MRHAPTETCACDAMSLPLINRELAQALRIPPDVPTYYRVATKGKDMQSLFQILMLVLDIVWFFIIAHVIMSWLINFQVLNLNQQLVGQIWYMLNRILEPIYGRVRRFMPDLSGVDLAPLVVLIAVYACRIILQNNISAFY